jgi:hypothetical protein
MAKNEFDEFSDEDAPPVVTPVNTLQKDNSIIAAGSPGTIYDWTSAPLNSAKIPRMDLNGKIVTIKNAEIILPPINQPWEKSRKGDKELKNCIFTLFYDQQSQSENFSGVRVFKREDDGEIRYSHPTITKDRKNQASQLFGKYADYKKKNLNECSLHEFLAFLHTQPKAKIIKMAFTNPTNGAIVEKNMVDEFINP